VNQDCVRFLVSAGVFGADLGILLQ